MDDDAEKKSSIPMMPSNEEMAANGSMEPGEKSAPHSPMLKAAGENGEVPSEDPPPDPQTIKKKKREVYKNLFVLCLVWFFIFSPYMALEVLQSSLNPHAGLGVTAISVLYTMKILSSFFGPLIIHKLTAKWTLVIGWICHTLFVVANYYPTWITLLSAGVLVGMTVGPIWICNGVYITTLASEMAELTGDSRGAKLSKFYGIFGLIPPFTGIVGNFVSSFILKTFKSAPEYSDIALNASVVNASLTEEWFNNSSVSCGANYCPYEYDDYLDADVNKDLAAASLPDKNAVYILLTIYLIMSILGVVLTALFLCNVPEKKHNDSFLQSVVKNFNSFMDKRLLILVPVFFFMFMRRATVSASFTKAYVTCTLGIDMVGYVMASRGVASITASYISGHVGQKIHRNYQFVVAMVLWVGVTVTWLLWEPRSDQLYAFFLIAIISGVVNSIDIVQFQAFLGDTFADKKTETFACQNFWSGIAMAVVFAYSGHLCFNIQTYLLSAMGIAAIIGYLTLYFSIERSNKKKAKLQSEENAQC